MEDEPSLAACLHTRVYVVSFQAPSCPSGLPCVNRIGDVCLFISLSYHQDEIIV